MEISESSKGCEMARNPSWTKEEIILASEVYIRADGRVLGPKDADVIELSYFLRRADFHGDAERDEKFRMPKSVGLKLANIRGADPTRPGGLMNGSQFDGIFWEEFRGDEGKLFDAAASIKARKRIR